MKKTPCNKYTAKDVPSLLDNIPFFHDLALSDPEQYQRLLSHGSVVEMKAGDVLITKGATDQIFYFLLKGELEVYAVDKLTRKSQPVSRVSQGQLLGALAVLAGLPRTATVAASKASGDALLFALDFSVFGEIDDFSTISLSAKLTFYRMIINSTRFKLESYKKQDESHPLAGVLKSVKRYEGPRDTADELHYHARQASTLARLLQKWNEVQ